MPYAYLCRCAEAGISVHVAGVFGSGLLVDSTATYAYKAAPPEVRQGLGFRVVFRVWI